MAENTYGLIAVFNSAPDIYRAAEKVRDAGFHRWDVLSPFPVHGMEKAMGLPRSRVPAFTFIGGAVGFLTGMFLAWYMGEFDYPLIVGGMPFFSPIYPFPIAYELTILLAAFGAFFGMFITNLLPQPYHPVMHFERWKEITDDRFAILIEARDPQFNAQETTSFLQSLGGEDVTELPE